LSFMEGRLFTISSCGRTSKGAIAESKKK